MLYPKLSLNRSRSQDYVLKKRLLKPEKERMFVGKYEPNGLGRLLYIGTHGAYMLEGVFVKGLATGYARWIWNDGVCYQGTLNKFKCNGKGKKIMGKPYQDIIQEGTWKND